MTKEIPILICGAGSVGLSLAAEMGWRNIESMLIESGESLNPHPRANAVANRTMEYYRRWGVDNALTEAGFLQIILLITIGSLACMAANSIMYHYHHLKK